jgi:hypothetical protein
MKIKIPKYLLKKLSTKQLILTGLIALVFLTAAFILFLNGKELYIVPQAPVVITPKAEVSKKVSPFSGLNCSRYRTRAFAVIIAQYTETMPLSGISQADIIIEGPTANPGGVTRLIAIFQCKIPKEAGSVRSVRPYMAQLAKGYDVMLNSWGGASSAIAKIKELNIDWFDGRANPGGAFFRKNNRYAPHNGFLRPSALLRYAKANKISIKNKFKGYKFLSANVRPKKRSQVINVDYFYPIKFVYDQKGRYYRYWNNTRAIDLNTGKQAFAKNVILMKTIQGVLRPGVADIKVTGNGKALIYRLGGVVNATWRKKSSNSPLLFYDSKGKEIKFAPGLIWIELVEDF